MYLHTFFEFVSPFQDDRHENCQSNVAEIVAHLMQLHSEDKAMI